MARSSRSGAIDNLPGWLTTVTARICLNVLRTRARRPTAPLAEDAPPGPGTGTPAVTPEEQVVLADHVLQPLRPQAVGERARRPIRRFGGRQAGGFEQVGHARKLVVRALRG